MPGPLLVTHARDFALNASAPLVTSVGPARGGLAGRTRLALSHGGSVFAQEAPRTHPPKNNAVTNPAAPIMGPSLSPSDIFLAAKEGPERGCGVIWFPRQAPGRSRRGFGLWAGKQDSAGTRTQAGAPSCSDAGEPLEEPSTAPSPRENDFLPPVILAEKTFVHLLHHVGQHRAGIVSKVQVPDLRHGHGDDGESFFVFFGGARAQLRSNREAAPQSQGSIQRVPIICHQPGWSR